MPKEREKEHLFAIREFMKCCEMNTLWFSDKEQLSEKWNKKKNIDLKRKQIA